MIVVENKKDLPLLDYEAQGVKVVDFTNDKYESIYSDARSGFLFDIFDEPYEKI